MDIDYWMIAAGVLWVLVGAAVMIKKESLFKKQLKNSPQYLSRADLFFCVVFGVAWPLFVAVDWLSSVGFWHAISSWSEKPIRRKRP